MYNALTLKTKPIVKPVLLTLLGAAIMTTSAKVSVPIGPVPITMHTVGVIVLGLLFGSKIAVSSMITYLLLGTYLPVFTNGGGIPCLIASPTAGYLYGMIPASYLAGKIKDLKMNLLMAAITLLVVPAVIHLGGFLWLTALIGSKNALAVGFFPFGVPATCKYLFTLFLYLFTVKK